MFDKVRNEGGRASCQDNWPVFHLMRGSQFSAWDEDTLRSYQNDLRKAEEEGRNLLTEKYGYMMASTNPDEFSRIRDRLPYVAEEKRALIEEILTAVMRQTEEFMAEYPAFLGHSRTLHTKGDTPFSTSIETYSRGELCTYSEETLKKYLHHIREAEKRGDRIVYDIYTATVHGYGYETLKEANDANR